MNIELLSAETIDKINIIKKYSKGIPKKGKPYTIDDFLKNSNIVDLDITDNQIFRVKELIEVSNKLNFFYKIEWIKKFLIGGLEDNFILRIIRLMDYNNRPDVKISDNTYEKMEILYGEEYAKENYNKRTNRFKSGDKNPGYNHGGRLSPFSKNFKKYEDLTEEEITEKLDKIYEKVSTSNKENGNNNTTLIYYIKQGYTEDEARVKLKERQTTFSLEKCIEKYGLEEGTRIFNERQEKWQSTLKSKDPEEIKRINRDKGKGLNVGWGVQKIRRLGIEVAKSKYCILYYIRFYNEDIEFWKIGITGKGIDYRFGTESSLLAKSNLKREVILIEESNYYDCFIKEQCILRSNDEYRISVDLPYFTSSECFSKDISLDVDFGIYEKLKSKI